jgi:hypothetical protein
VVKLACGPVVQVVEQFAGSQAGEDSRFGVQGVASSGGRFANLFGLARFPGGSPGFCIVLTPLHRSAAKNPRRRCRDRGRVANPDGLSRYAVKAVGGSGTSRYLPGAWPGIEAVPNYGRNIRLGKRRCAQAGSVTSVKYATTLLACCQSAG